jgi:hypothetical protein
VKFNSLLGIVMVAPLIIGLGSLRRDLPERWELTEGALTLAGLGAVSVLAFGSAAHYWWYSLLPLGLLLPALLAAHCRPVFAAAAALILGCAVVSTTAFGMGSWATSRACPIGRLLCERRCWLSRSIRWYSPLCSPSGGTMRERSRIATIGSRAPIVGFSWLSAELNLVTGVLTQRLTALKATHGTGKFMVIHPTLHPKPLAAARPFIHPSELPALDAAFSAAKRTGGSCKVEYRLASADGTDLRQERWVAAEGTVVRDANGRPVQLLGVTRDITEHRQAERALAERNLQLGLAGQFALVGTYVFDAGSDGIKFRLAMQPSTACPRGLRRLAVPNGETEYTPVICLP